ncbi:MAG: Hsp20/alpha crystallin family protein [Candidatus Competibacteraceae bacterium]|nr:Hsp20/alpha crystallin family protein [Candidatus Competibacteraceae bacterium]
MSTLNQIREGLSQAWETLSDGWHELRDRATHALTHFHPKHSGTGLETVDEQMVRSGSRWGLLAAEVSENDDQVVVNLEAPGMEADNFELQVVDEYLVVRGEKRTEREERKGRYYVMERAYGSFERAIPLPTAVEADQAHAKYRNGVLRIALPKSPQARARRIEVSVE